MYQDVHILEKYNALELNPPEIFFFIEEKCFLDDGT